MSSCFTGRRLKRLRSKATRAEHAFKHARLIDAAVQPAVRYHSGVAHAGEQFLFLAHEVVARHLLSDDREFFPFLQQAKMKHEHNSRE